MFIQRELFNILVYERRLRNRDMRNKYKLIREFGTGYIVVLKKQLKSSIKNGVSHKLLSKTKGPKRVLEKNTPISYYIMRLYFCEGLGRPVIKLKESMFRM